MKRSSVEKFWDRVVKTDGCWEWTGAKHRTGYAYLSLSGDVNVRAHRFAYQLLVGPIPEGLVLDHLCRNRGCVNPDHLEPVTIAENTARGLSITTAYARRSSCINGHPFTPENTGTASRGGRRCLTCHRENAATRTACPECGKVMRRGSLRRHLLVMHDQERAA